MYWDSRLIILCRKRWRRLWRKPRGDTLKKNSRWRCLVRFSIRRRVGRSRKGLSSRYNAFGQNVRFVVTNLEHWKRCFIYETGNCGRGAMELFIKEHKTHILSDRTSCNRFEANKFRLFLHSVAYVLLQTFRRLHLQGSEFARAQFDTIRLKLIKIGARVRQLRTRIKIHLPSSFPLKVELRKIWLSCCGAGYTWLP